MGTKKWKGFVHKHLFCPRVNLKMEPCIPTSDALRLLLRQYLSGYTVSSWMDRGHQKQGKGFAYSLVLLCPLPERQFLHRSSSGQRRGILRRLDGAILCVVQRLLLQEVGPSGHSSTRNPPPPPYSKTLFINIHSPIRKHIHPSNIQSSSVFTEINTERSMTETDGYRSIFNFLRKHLSALGRNSLFKKKGNLYLG